MKKTPLSNGFMFLGILGIIIFGIRLFYGTINETWGFLMFFMSIIIFVASVISITPELPHIKDENFDKQVENIQKQYRDFNKNIEPSPDNLEKITIKKAKRNITKKVIKKSTKKK